VSGQATGAGAGSIGGAATTGTGRVGNVDVLRAVAALGVLASHAYSLGGRPLPIRADYWYDVPLMQTATGVWLFFAISGYVISKPFVDRLLTGRPLPELVPYALRRTLRIYPLYWLSLTAVIVIAGAGQARLWHYPVHYALLHNLVPGRQEAIFSVAWTLTLEVLFYAAVPVLALALRRGRRASSPERLALLVLVSFALSVGFTLVADLTGGGQTGLWLRGSLPATWQMFCPGILLAVVPHVRAPGWRRWLVELPSSRRAIWVAAAALVVAALVGSLAPLRFGVVEYQLVADASHPLFAIGYGLVLAAAVRSGAWFQRRARWVLHLGLVSYGIYLLHAVLTSALLTSDGRQFIPLPHGGLGAFVVHLAFLTALTIPLAMASWRWFEQPFIRLAGTLSERWRDRAVQRERGRPPAPSPPYAGVSSDPE
jgi:acetyltransferase